jgi:hypothetical protein
MMTYGRSPAAIHLGEICSSGELSIPTVRSIGKILTGISKQVNQLQRAYKATFIDSKTYANMLRLLRNDVSRQIVKSLMCEQDLILDLTRNVALAHIKRAEQVTMIGALAKKYEKDALAIEKYVKSNPPNRPESFHGTTLGIKRDGDLSPFPLYKFHELGGALFLVEQRPDLNEVDKTERLRQKHIRRTNKYPKRKN